MPAMRPYALSVGVWGIGFTVGLCTAAAYGTLPAANHHAAAQGPAGSLSWKPLAGAKEFGFSKDLTYIPRTYPDAVRTLAGSEIEIKGYMISMQLNGKNTHFLLVPYPPSCPYCIPGGPNQTIEVNTKTPVAFSFDPVLLRGILRIHDNDMSDLFYALDDAQAVGE